MKKINLLFYALALLGATSVAQDSAYLDIGNVRALIYANGNLFQNPNTARASFEVPKGSGVNSIYASSFWLSSESIRNNHRHISSSVENYGNQRNFNVGPVNLVNQIADTSSRFQRLWKIEKSEIDNHAQNWNTPGYVIPPSIIDWPGNGNTNNAQNLAPYADLDSDNIYEPQNGEYPIIKGDQAVFLILNDYRPGVVVEQLQPPPAPPIFLYNWTGLNIEMHVMLYAFDSPIPSISNAVFSNVVVHNRSNQAMDNHTDFHFSVFADFDLGGGNDDYIGTDTSKNIFYTYNGSLFDNGSGGSNGYGNKLAAQGVQFLDYDIDHSIYYNIGNGPNGDPVMPEQYVNYQRGIWKNGQPFYYGGNAFDYCTDTAQAIKYVFTGDPTLINDTTQWTESNPCLNSTSSANPNGDRRIIGGPNVPRQLNIGESVEINYAYIFARDQDSSTYIGEPVDQLILVADSVKDFFDQNIVTGINNSITSPEIEFTLFPNPANQRVLLKLDESNFEITLFDISGSAVNHFRNTTSIDVSALSKGIYFLQVKTADQIGTKKLIVSD